MTTHLMTIHSTGQVGLFLHDDHVATEIRRALRDGARSLRVGGLKEWGTLQEWLVDHISSIH
jgi:hypothetical protein